MSRAAEALAGKIKNEGICPTSVEVIARIYDDLEKELDGDDVRYSLDGVLLVRCSEGMVRVTRRV